MSSENRYLITNLNSINRKIFNGCVTLKRKCCYVDEIFITGCTDWKLSFWQLSVQLVTKMLSKRNFNFCVCQNKQDRRWNADKPSAALDPYIPTWLTTSSANHRPANFWKSFFFFWNIGRKLWKVVQSHVELMWINFKFEASILWFLKYK